MPHFEQFIVEYLNWKGYLVRQNIKVGPLAHGGWEMELDVVGYHPDKKDLVHYEPSLDALSYEKREKRYRKKFEAGRTYIRSAIFPWVPVEIPLRQVAVFPNCSLGYREMAGGTVITIDELFSDVRRDILSVGSANKHAIPEIYPLLRTLQLSHCGYSRAL
jgi:hypothetical protein